jgi:hypothetical protein
VIPIELEHPGGLRVENRRMRHQGLLDEGGEIAENLLDVFLT